LQKLLQDVRDGVVDCVMVYKVDRLTRSLLDFARIMEVLDKHGASFVSVTQQFNTTSSLGRLTLNILLSFAQFEREMIAERTRDKVQAARRRGKWTGGPVPFGYGARDKKLVVDEVEAHTVREAFSLFLQHRQFAPVARMLTAQGLLPRAPKRPAKRGSRWTKRAISRIIRNPIYGGFVLSHEELHRGEHEPLVDEATFRQARHLIASVKARRRQLGVNPVYVLRGLLRCGRCGADMAPASSKARSKSHRYYRCTTRNTQGLAACSAPLLPATELESFVAQHIAAAVSDQAMVRRIEDAVRVRVAARRAAILSIRSGLAGKIASASDRAAKLTEELLRLSGYARDLVEAKLRDETERLAAVQRQLMQAERDLVALEIAEADVFWMKATLTDFGKIWEHMSPENRGRLLRALIVEIRAHDESHTITIELVNVAADSAAGAS
jgi:DNA invertase Pin-like site-specific DNA recombinase